VDRREDHAVPAMGAWQSPLKAVTALAWALPLEGRLRGRQFRSGYRRRSAVPA
jgi:hypothetical protein